MKVISNEFDIMISCLEKALSEKRTSIISNDLQLSIINKTEINLIKYRIQRLKKEKEEILNNWPNKENVIFNFKKRVYDISCDILMIENN